VWEMQDPEVRQKIAHFASSPHLVTWSRSAERDMASVAGMTKGAVLEAIVDHITCGYIFHAEYMKNGDLAHIFNCFVGRHRRYIKVKFWILANEERMHVFSAHPER